MEAPRTLRKKRTGHGGTCSSVPASHRRNLHSRGTVIPALFYPLPYLPRTGDITLPRTLSVPNTRLPIPHSTSSIRPRRPAVPSALPLGTQINFPTDPAESLRVRHFPPRQERLPSTSTSRNTLSTRHFRLPSNIAAEKGREKE